jgi:hypothetical protein
MPYTGPNLKTPFLTGPGAGTTGTTTETPTEKIVNYGPESDQVNDVAKEIYQSIEPLTYADMNLGYPLLKYLDGVGLMWDDINKIIRDRITPHGGIIPGYAMVMTLSECPPTWLPWLGQFTGVPAPPETPASIDRELIVAASGLNRGTPAAIKAAVAVKLVGGKRVDLFERNEGKAYSLLVVTYTSETPSQLAIETLLFGDETIPGGIQVKYKCVPGWVYEGIPETGKTYKQLKEEYATYEKLALKTP